MTATTEQQEKLRAEIDKALRESIDRCARCEACDTQVDAVMAVVQPIADGSKMLGHIAATLARAMEAARIEMLQNGPEKAMQWILNSLPDQWEGEPWDGKESADQWFDRTADSGEGRRER